MSDKYVIEFDDEEILVEGCSYRRISGTKILVYADAIKNLTPAETKKEEKTIKDITYGDGYFYINILGNIEKVTWIDAQADRFRRVCGNAFLTEEDARFELKRIEIMGIIRKYAEPLNTPWDCKEPHFYLSASLSAMAVTICCNTSFKNNGFYFSTEIDAKKVIDEVGGADLLRYYFMVED